MNSSLRFDLSTVEYTPSGRVMQVEYATRAVLRSGTLVGMSGKDCVVLALDSMLMDRLYETNAGGRIFSIEQNIGIAFSGLLADGNFVVDIARQEAKIFRMEYDRCIPASVLAENLAQYIHVYTLYSKLRPFGVTVVIAAWDIHDGPQMFKVEPCGSYSGYYTCSAGRFGAEAQVELNKYKLKNMNAQSLLEAAGKIIYKLNYDDMSNFRLESSIVGLDTCGEHMINHKKWSGYALKAPKHAVNEPEYMKFK